MARKRTIKVSKSPAEPKASAGAPSKAPRISGVRSADSVDRVYVTIKQLAVEYRFRPGEHINEVELAGRLGVSRTPIREALNRLVRDGFMSFIPNRGFHAREISPEGVRDLYELRAAIEVAAFKLACVRATDREIEETAAIWLERDDRGPNSDWGKIAISDESFHLALTKLSQNAQMVEALEGINSRIRFFRRIDLETPRRRIGTHDEHSAIIDALRARDAARGAGILESHVTLSSTHAIEVTKEGLARIFFGHAA